MSATKMSINHYLSELPETQFWWSKYMIMESYANTPSSNHKTFTFDHLKNQDEEESLIADEHQQLEIPKMPLFQKPLTPSDVGKLNRLVIPKQHAEKYFPPNGGGGEKSFLLSFEDEVAARKSWRFRYSYWNSSQSYVLTRGWSRFVKEKRLRAGDIVLFSRHREDSRRLFIGWRRRNSGGGGGGGWRRKFSHPSQYQVSLSSLPYQSECVHAGSVIRNQTTSTSGNSKRLRLFGVNLESEPLTPEGSPISSQGQTLQHPYHQY